MTFWTWGTLAGSLLDAPQCLGMTGTVTSLIDNDTFAYAYVTTKVETVRARIDPDAAVGDTVRIYTSDGVNYWDVTDSLVFCDGVLNKPSGIVAAGQQQYDSIKGFANATCLVGYLFAVVLIGSIICNKVYNKTEGKVYVKRKDTNTPYRR